MKEIFIVLFMILLLNSCGNVPSDPSAAPIDNGLWTLELATNTGLDVGLIGDLNTSGGRLSFPTMGEGTYSIRSQRCNFNTEANFSSKNLSRVSFSYEALTAQMPVEEVACIFNIQVFTHGYDKGIQGQFTLVKKEDFDYQTASFLGREFHAVGGYQVRDTTDQNTKLIFRPGKAGLAFFQGCGNTMDKEFVNEVSFSIHDLTKGRVRDCVYDFGFEFADGTLGLFTFNLKVFKDIIAIPDPILTYEDGELKLEALPPVAMASINDTVKKYRSLRKNVTVKEKVAQDTAVHVRIITANGRYNLLGVKNGEVIWRPSILY